MTVRDDLPSADSPHGTHRRRAGRAKWRLLGAAVGMAILLGAGWLAAVAFQSPAQVAARTAAPPPTEITSSVTRGELARTISMKATVEREQRFSATLLPGADPREVVTRLPHAIGEELSPLAVVVEVNGRPRFAVAGAFPFYRPMRLGDVGPDVKQLQDALSAAGYRVTSDGRLGAETAAAISHVYSTAGYEMPSSPRSDEERPAAGSAPLSDTPPARTLSLPASEFLVLASLPGFLIDTPALGSVLGDSSRVTLGAGPTVAVGTVDAATAVTLRPGMAAAVQGPDASADAYVSAVEAVTTTDSGTTAAPDGVSGKADETWRVSLAFSTTPPASWLGVETLGVVTVSVNASESLIVPTVAVIPGGDDDPHVLKRRSDGTFQSVRVKEIGVLAGKSAIRPIDDDTLAVGDEVKVG